MTDKIYPLEAARALALHMQGLNVPNGEEPEATPDAIYRMVERLGCVQIDTLQMVRRSQYLVIWSRLGSYDPVDFERLIYDPTKRRLFEYWRHAASIIPLRDYRYSLPDMRWFSDGNHHWNSGWIHQDGNAALAGAVLERVRNEGALRAADFERAAEPRGPWWDWKPAKQALEHLFNTGELMIAGRENFHRVYDLKDRVLPDWVDRSEAWWEERNRFRVEQALRALGICEPAQVAEYAYLKRGEAAPFVKEMVEDGTAVPVGISGLDGYVTDMIVHQENLPLLERAAEGKIRAERTTFLSPFDSLFWAGGRDEKMWGFRNVLEAYKPAPAREWGYFCLPVLHRGRLVGRFDPKLERQSGKLRLISLYLQPGVSPDEELVADVAAAMRDFMAFHKASELAIERSQPAGFGEMLLSAL